MNKRKKRYLKILPVLVCFYLTIPNNAISHTKNNTSETRQQEGSEINETNPHVLNCQQPLGYHLSYKEFSCPIGGEKFKSLILGTHSTFGRHLDWEPRSYMQFPAPLAVCPSNGFVISHREYTDSDLEKIGNVLTSEEYKSVFAKKHASYYLFYRFNQMLDENNDDHWWYLLNATWEAEQCKDDKKYQLYAQETIKIAKQTLKKFSTQDDLYWVLNIVIPNLNRRVGDFDSAQSWLDKFGDQLPQEEKPRKFYELAFKLLRKAITDQDTSKIPIQNPKNTKN